MNYRYLLLCLLLTQTFFAADYDCSGYTDDFDVRVLDAKYRPMEGAEVTVKFDRGTSFGEQYFTTPVKYTDSEGKVHITIYNQGTTTRKIDCEIEIVGSDGGYSKKVVVEANRHGSIVDVVLDQVYPLQFYVRDQYRAPIENASVTVGHKTGKTGPDGSVKFLFEKGTYDYFASYSSARQAGSILIEDDQSFEVLFHHSDITIDIKDDQGNPLDATLEIFNQTVQVENGHFEYNETYGTEIDYSVRYGGYVESGVIYPQTEENVEVVFDVHAPSFEEIEPHAIGKTMRLVINVDDEGEYASGIDVMSIKVTYRAEPAEATAPWNTAITFATAYNVFTADFPELPPDTIISFRIEVKDKAGNRADIDGKFTTFEAEEPENGDSDGTDTQPTVENDQEIPLIYIGSGVILIILGIYLYFRIKSGGGSSV